MSFLETGKVRNTENIFGQERKSLGERNDCVVRAVAVAFGMLYQQSHKYCKYILNREDKKGTYTLREFDGNDFLSQLCTPLVFNRTHYRQCKHPQKIDLIMNSRATGTGLYLPKFLEDYPKGTYLVLSSGHAYAVVDGEVWGNPDDHRTYVKIAYRLDGNVDIAKKSLKGFMYAMIFGGKNMK